MCLGAQPEQGCPVCSIPATPSLGAPETMEVAWYSLEIVIFQQFVTLDNRLTLHFRGDHATVVRPFIFGFHVPFLLLYFLAATAENFSQNMGSPLFDCCFVASSCIISQCSTRIPSLMRRMSAAIQFTGCPNPENRPCTITKSPSATIIPGSYFNVGGRLLIRLKRPSRPGAI